MGQGQCAAGADPCLVYVRPNLVGDPKSTERNGSGGFLNTAAFARPAKGNTGDAPRNVVQKAGINNWNLAAFKNFGLGGASGRRKLQVRIEAYNVLNHTQFDNIDRTARFDAQGNQVNAAFGLPTTSRQPRIIQGRSGCPSSRVTTREARRGLGRRKERMTRGVGPYGLTRRDLLRVAVSASLAPLVPRFAAAEPARHATLDLAALRRARGASSPRADPAPRASVSSACRDGPRCRARLKNTGRSAAAVAEVVLFDVPHALPPETPIYGEGFQMLSQTGGTIGQPADLGDYTDAKHYRDAPARGRDRRLQPARSDARPVVRTASWPSRRLGASSAASRCGPSSLRIVMDAEGRTLGPGRGVGARGIRLPLRPRPRGAAGRAGRPHRHPSSASAHGCAPPSGWCSWYCFGPKVTADDVRRNLDVIARETPGLRYIQVDDGYQPAMGDWLETGAAFGGNVQGVLKEIRARGFEPAIWVAPFVAEKDSTRLPGTSRVVRDGRVRTAAALGRGDVRRLAPRAVVRARWHASRRPSPTSSPSSAPCARTGAARTSSSTRTSGGRCTADGSTTRAPHASKPTGGAWRRCGGERGTRSFSGATTRSGLRSGSCTAHAARTTSSARGRA